jgi:hypothetical protein
MSSAAASPAGNWLPASFGFRGESFPGRTCAFPSKCQIDLSRHIAEFNISLATTHAVAAVAMVLNPVYPQSRNN